MITDAWGKTTGEILCGRKEQIAIFFTDDISDVTCKDCRAVYDVRRKPLLVTCEEIAEALDPLLRNPPF